MRSFFKRVSALAADAFHSTRALRLNDLSNVCAQPRTARARTGAQRFRVQGLRFRRPRTSADGNAEERQAIRSTSTDSRRRTSFAAGMICEELCHVENHALDDEVAALLCPAQRSEEGVMVPRRTVKSQATRAEGGERGVDAVSRGLRAAPHLPTLAHPAARLPPKCYWLWRCPTCASQSLPPSSWAPCSCLAALRSLPAHPRAGWPASP